ncbi:MAG: TetR/AcrR family transcriptional regulator [Atopobiaceae bacterium]
MEAPAATRKLSLVGASQDRRTVRTRQALRDALALEIEKTGDLSRVTVKAVADTAGVTRRTFYSHFKDIPDLVGQIESETVSDVSCLVRKLAQTNLDELQDAIAQFEPCPESVELLEYFQERRSYLPALLGTGGDPGFVEKLKEAAYAAVSGRASQGIVFPVTDELFEYYLTFAISAEVGVLLRWMRTGMQESPYMMACVMTALMFVRPGDLYGKKIKFGVPCLDDLADMAQEKKEMQE